MKHRLTALSASVALSACTGSPTALPATGGPDQILYGVEHSMVADGVIRGRLQADSAFLFVRHGTATLHGVTLVLSSPVPHQGARLTAVEGRIELAQPVLVAAGNVDFTAAGGNRRLESEYLEVDLGANTVTTSAPATVTIGEADRQVEGFAGNLQLHPTSAD